MPQLQPGGALDLPGVQIRSTGVGAQVEAISLVQTPGTDRGFEDVAESMVGLGAPQLGVIGLLRVLDLASVQPVLAIPLDDLTTAPGSASSGRTRGIDDGSALEVTVEAPDDDQGQVVLEVDGSGVVSWHLPNLTARAPGSRAFAVQTFRIPVVQADIPGDPAPLGERALLAIGVRKLLHVLRYPVEKGAGVATKFLASTWEAKNRPYGVRLVGDTGLTGSPGFALSPDQLTSLSGKPTLLLVHGTFSTAASGFAGIAADQAMLAQLHSLYEGRVLVFDHPSVSVSPVDNAQWFLDHIPDTVDLTLDVVTHSRGGLVGRALTATPTFAQNGLRPPRIRRMIHVAAPNAGTPLASVERLGTLLDSVTNLTMLLPSDTISVPLTAIVETVKQLGTGAVDRLDGLTAMDPVGAFLPALQPGIGISQGTVCTIASDFAAAADSPLPIRALDVLVDAYFKAGNDLVVPTAGVSQAPGLKVAHAVTVPSNLAVNHNSFFHQPEVLSLIGTWLKTAG